METTASVAEPGLDLLPDVDELVPDGEIGSADVGDLPPDDRPLEHVAAVSPVLGPRKHPLAAPLHRTIKKGMRGDDVRAIFRALSKWEHQHSLGRYVEKPTPLYGPGKEKRVKRFQHHMHLRADGEYGPSTHRKLLPWFDRYGAHVLLHFHPGTPEEKTRQTIVATALFSYHHAPRHYSQVASLRCQAYYQKIKPPSMWWYEDCSGHDLWCKWVAGVTSAGPVDGWTGSMQEHGRRVSYDQAKIADSVFYDGHVATLVSKRGDGFVVSHGHEGGPFYERRLYRSDFVEIRSYI